MAKLKGVLKKVGNDWWQLPRLRRLELKSGKSKGIYNTPALRRERVRARIRTPQEADQARRAFEKSGGPRDKFSMMAKEKASITELQAMGMTDEQAVLFKRTGKYPTDFQVHHRVPIKAGGSNDMDNLVLIKNDPDHKLITAQQQSILRRYPSGTFTDVELPKTPQGTTTWPQSGQGAYMR
ncbi:MAG: HNH endonuclease [Propionibacteriales bacterium]|nr:HNH endonuclease [Propionibacteriales bacterium]